MKLRKTKIPTKTRTEIEQEIEDVLSGKDKSKRGKMLRRASKGLMFTMSKEQIKDLFVKEYIKKYGELSSGKITIEELKEQSLKDSKKARTTGTKAQ